MNRILEQINELDFSERIQLVEDLWDSVAARAETLPLTDAQREELDRRLALHSQNPGRGETLDSIVRELGVTL